MTRDPWADAREILAARSPAHHQTASFDEFIDHLLPNLIASLRPIEVSTPRGLRGRLSHTLSLGDLRIEPPNHTEADGQTEALLPSVCRQRNLTYSLVISATVRHRWRPIDGSNARPGQRKRRLLIARLPAMVGSRHCTLHGFSEALRVEGGEDPTDPGGYFIIDGRERVLIAQEQSARNSVFCTREFCEVYSRAANSHLPPQRLAIQIKSVRVKVLDLSRFNIKNRRTANVLRVSIRGLHDDVDLVVLLAALGVQTEKAMCDLLGVSEDQAAAEFLRPTLAIGGKAFGATMAQTERYVDMIARRGGGGQDDAPTRITHGVDILRGSVLPHMGLSSAEDGRKAAFIAMMVRRFVAVNLGREKPDRRDHLGRRRAELAGPLLLDVMRREIGAAWEKTRSLLRSVCEEKRKIPPLGKLLTFNSVGSNLHFALVTGNWGRGRVGVCQELNRMNRTATLRHLRRFASSVNGRTKSVGPRHLDATHWGYICPCETPEGEAVGLTRNLSLATSIRRASDEEVVVAYIRAAGHEPLPAAPAGAHLETDRIFVNGRWLAVADDGQILGLASDLRDARATGVIDAHVSISTDPMRGELHVWTDAGRLLRPLMRVDRDAADNLETHGGVDWIDPLEEENAMIAMTPSDLKQASILGEDAYTTHYTHREVHPSLILGVSAARIPFPDHNQRPRNTYQSAMGKQAVGAPLPGEHLRFESKRLTLDYAQAPLVGTGADDLTGGSLAPTGANCVLAIATYTGYNQEDSLILNLNALDRGLFRVTNVRTYTAVAESGSRICIPDPATTIGMRRANYDKLEADGTPAVRTVIRTGDVLIGKIVEAEEAPFGAGETDLCFRDRSIIARGDGHVHRVHETYTAQGRRMVHVQVLQVRVPTVGDKLSSRHGQKGTVGMVYRQEDMPFGHNGLSVDVILNPHAIPRRMTIGQLLEMLVGTESAVSGVIEDATPFDQHSLPLLQRRLRELGYDGLGRTVLRCGFTGERIKALIFTGPCYYQRLLHMVQDKVQARARGPVDRLTRQPTRGRRQNGGMRFGEMERDAVIAHGAAVVLRERLLTQRDEYRVTVCSACGDMCPWSEKHQRGGCRACRVTTEMRTVTLPYAGKLLVQELGAMGLNVSILTDRHPTDRQRAIAEDDPRPKVGFDMLTPDQVQRLEEGWKPPLTRDEAVSGMNPNGGYAWLTSPDRACATSK